METTEYIELFWDCPHCGHSHISAVFNSQGNRCPNCLQWRTEDVSLYEAPDSQVITDPALINRKPFWVCKVCHAVNEDTGIAAHLLQCANCDNYQTSEVGGITGNEASDREAPDALPVGAPVEYKEKEIENEKPKNQSKRPHWIVVGLTGLLMAGSGFFGGTLWSSYQEHHALLTVQVADLKWAIEVDVQERQPVIRQDWKDAVPVEADIQTSERKQRGVRQEQQGWRTVQVPEQYQSGTRTETYSDSERYQSGTRQECKTTSMGNGVGQRTCRDVAVYSTRSIQRNRSVPVYSTRMVSRQEPNLVSIPVYDTWVTYQIEDWVPKQTYRQAGENDSQRQTPIVKLKQKPPQRIAATRATCQLAGTYSIEKWFQAPETRSGEWTLPCPEYDRLNIGDRAVIRRKGADSATLVNVNPR